RTLYRNALSDRLGFPEQGEEGRARGGAFSAVPHLESFVEGKQRSGAARAHDLPHRHAGGRYAGNYFDPIRVAANALSRSDIPDDKPEICGPSRQAAHEPCVPVRSVSDQDAGPPTFGR